MVSRFPDELSTHWLFWIYSRTKHNLSCHTPAPHLIRHMLIMSSVRAASASGPITVRIQEKERNSRQCRAQMSYPVNFIPLSKFLRKDANGEKVEQKIHPNNYSGDC